MALKYLNPVPIEQTDYSLDDDEIRARFDEYDGKLTDEHVAILDDCADAWCEYCNNPTDENFAAFEQRAELVENAGLAGTFMVCAW